MKHLKGIPGRIFIVVLLTGIIGISGILLMKYEMSLLTDNHRVIVEEHVENRESMSQILELVYKNRSLMADCLLVSNGEKRKKLEKEEREIRKEVQRKLNQFGERMTENTEEELYHNLYSSFQRYLQIASVAEKLYLEGNEKTASEYVSNNLVKCSQDINENINKLDAQMVYEMEEAKGQMEKKSEISRISAVFCVVMIVLAVGLCLFYCVKVTSELERQRTGLAEEVKRQTEELRRNSDQMLDIKDQTIIGMANLIENRDGDTGGHIKRTGMYVELLAKRAKKHGYYRGILTDHYINLLVKAAPMHDVGKIVVPDHILRKPGRLTAEEFEQIKRHASEGGRIVKEVFGNIEDNDYVEIAAQIAEYHHEKWDGSGYPHGKREEEIPLCARIMAIADVYDALVEKRCYKEPMSYEQAMSIIEESAGSHFDPVLVQLFRGMEKEVIAISESLAD